MKSVLVKFRNRTNAFLRNVSGASLIEYAVLLGVVLAVAVGGIVLVGNKVNNTFNKVQGTINQ
jgi:Flp pilus assembly pilin Flp